MRGGVLVALAVALAGTGSPKAGENSTAAGKPNHAAPQAKAGKNPSSRGDDVKKKPLAPVQKRNERPSTDAEPASVKAWREADI